MCLIVIIPRSCFDMSDRYMAACELSNVMVTLDQINIGSHGVFASIDTVSNSVA